MNVSRTLGALQTRNVMYKLMLNASFLKFFYSTKTIVTYTVFTVAVPVPYFPNVNFNSLNLCLLITQ